MGKIKHRLTNNGIINKENKNYKPLYDKKNKMYVEYDLDAYLEFLDKKFIANKEKNQEDIFFDLYEGLNGKRRIKNSSDDTPYSSSYNKTINRIHRRLIYGEKKRDDKDTNIASEQKCLNYLELLEDKYGLSLIVRINDPKNYQISLDVMLLLSLFKASDWYNHTIYTNDGIHETYKKQFMAIDDKIKILYRTDSKMIEKWNEILLPIKSVVSWDFPNWSKVWLKNTPGLEYLDPVYDIAEKGYDLYIKNQHLFRYDIGNCKKEVDTKLKKREQWLAEENPYNLKDYDEFVQDLLIETFKKIVKSEFQIELYSNYS